MLGVDATPGLRQRWRREVVGVEGAIVHGQIITQAVEQDSHGSVLHGL